MKKYGIMLVWLSAICRAEILEISDHHAVLSDACLSHLDGTLLVWPQARVTQGDFGPGAVTPVSVIYQPLREGVPGHKEYNPDHDRRTVIVRSAPSTDKTPPAPGTRDNVVWRDQGVEGAAILGTFTMGAGTTRSRPGFDQYSSTWHGFLEPLLDVWTHIRRMAHATEKKEAKALAAATAIGATTKARKRCPRYDVFLTDEVLGRRKDWIQKGYLTAYWRALASLPEDAALSPVFGGEQGGGLWSVADAILDLKNTRTFKLRKAKTHPGSAAAANESHYHHHQDEHEEEQVLLPWSTVASGPMSCYKKVLVGAPCCSHYPFNGRGSENLLGRFGDCMLEAQHHVSAMDDMVASAKVLPIRVLESYSAKPGSSSSSSSSSSSGGEGGEGTRVGAATTESLFASQAFNVVPARRRDAASTLEDLKVLVLDRDECDRRLTNPDAFLGQIRALFDKLQREAPPPAEHNKHHHQPAHHPPRKVQVRHAYFEHLSVREQMATAADSDLVLAAHGGGGGWMAVMPKGGVLVELRHAGASRCFAAYASWAGVIRLAVDDLPRFVNKSCHRASGWTEGDRHIVPQWSVVGPAIERAVRLLTSRTRKNITAAGAPTMEAELAGRAFKAPGKAAAALPAPLFLPPLKEPVKRAKTLHDESHHGKKKEGEEAKKKASTSSSSSSGKSDPLTEEEMEKRRKENQEKRKAERRAAREAARLTKRYGVAAAAAGSTEQRKQLLRQFRFLMTH